jgi:hypothetical protein
MLSWFGTTKDSHRNGDDNKTFKVQVFSMRKKNFLGNISYFVQQKSKKIKKLEGIWHRNLDVTIH